MSRTLLLVDDSPVERALLAGFFKADYSVIEAESGEQALEIVRKSYKSISAVIMDILMPGMGGFKALAAIKGNPSWLSIPVIVATTLDDSASHEKAIACGADSFVTKPYSRFLLQYVVKNAIKLRETAAIANTMWLDALTGLLNREAFFSEAERMVEGHEPGYYVLSCFNIENFKIVNDQYGKDVGDMVLKHVASCISEFVAKNNGICCRYTGDWFAILYPYSYIDSKELQDNHQKATHPSCIVGPIRIRIGRYHVIDKTLPIDLMFDRASLAESTIRNLFDTYVAYYTEDMRDKLLQEQGIVDNMSNALHMGEFEPWFQPQYNHATGALIGAEALVRWKKRGKYISPAEFVPVFERNGFIYEMDKYIWEEVCIFLRRWLDEGKNPLPVSVNISRRDLHHRHIINAITDLTEKYHIPYDLLRLEITESAMTDNSIIDKVVELIKLGFTVGIDDFGSGYSSLNTLKDVPASILKLDIRFFEKTGNSERGGSIIESVVRMAKWLGMAVIAEGVEEKSQADYLKSIGCYYIQGYLYAKPMPVSDYEKLLEGKNREPKLSRMETLETLDSNLFWDPQSMETLIFNSYVGGACIFEYHKEKAELLRVNDRYIDEFGGLIPKGSRLANCGIIQFLDRANIRSFTEMLDKADKQNKEASCEIKLCSGTHIEYVRYTVRVIARSAERLLFYAVIVNETELRDAERKQKESSERLSIIMENVNGGVSAIQVFDNGTSNVIFHNDKYYQLFGYTREQAEAIHFDPLSCILPESFQYVMEKVKKLKTDGIPIIIDYAVSKADGTVAYIRANCSLMDMAGYGPVITSVLVDVTEQRTLQDQLRAIVDNINGGVTAISYTDGKSKLLLINNNYYDIIGYTKEQFQSEISNVFSLIHPEDRARIEGLFSGATEQQKSYTMEYRIVRRNGAVRHILCNTRVMRFFGVRDLVQLSVINDITALRVAQQQEHNLSVQLNGIMENISGGITATVFHDRNNLELIFSNDGFYELLGYTKQQLKAEVSSVFELILPDEREIILEEVERISREKTSGTLEYHCYKRDGSIISLQTINSVISIKGISEDVTLSITTDITGLRRAEEESRQSADRLKAVMNAMTSGIAAVTFRNKKIQFLFANDCYYKLHGVQHKQGQEEEYFLREALKRIHSEDRMRIQKLVTGSNALGQSCEAEYRVIHPDKSIRFVKVEITVTELFGVESPVLVAIFSDITAKKAAERQLCFLNETAHDIITQIDVDRAISETLYKIAGYFKSDRGYIVEIDEEKMQTSNTYECCSQGSIPQKESLQNMPFEKTAIWYRMLSRGEFIKISDVSLLREEQPELYELLSSQGIRSIICAPLIHDKKLIAFIGVDNPGAAIDQVEQLTALADYVTILLNRRNMARKIKNEINHIQQLISDTPGGFLRLEIIKDKAPVIDSVNEGFCKLLSMSREEVMDKYGNDIYGCLSPEDAAEAPEKLKQAYAAYGQYTSRCRLLKKNGDYIWVMIFGRFVHDENGKLFLNAYFTDITEQRREEENQAILLDNLPFGAAMYQFDNGKLVVIHRNLKYWQLVGRKPEQQNNIDVMDAIHPDDREVVLQEVKSAIRQNRTAVADMRILKGDGGYIPFHVTASIVPKDDGTYRLFVAYTDISEETMSLQEMLPIALSTIVSNTEDISYVKDKELRYICVSRAVADMAGANNPRDLIGKTAREVFPSDFAERFDADDRNVLETGKTVLRAVEHVPTANGGVCLARTSKFPILDSHGNSVGVYCISRDITAQKEKESQLELLTGSIPGGLAAYSISPEGIKTIYFNDGYYDFSGYSRAEYLELIEHEPLALMFPEDRPKLLALVRRFATEKQDGMSGECSYRCLTRSGEKRYMSLRAVLSQVGEQHFVLNVVQLDVTTQTLAERKQIELLDNLPVGAGMYEYDGEQLTVYHLNKQYERLVDLSNTACGTLSADYNIHPEDKAVVLAEIRDAIANNREAYCVIRLLCRDGQYAPFRLNANINNEKNGKYMLFVTFLRISQEEQNFESMLPHMFDTIMESSTDLAFAKDINFRYIRCSKPFADIVGLANVKSVIGKTDYELFPKEIADKFRSDDAALFANGKPQIDVTEAIPSPDGTLHYTRTSKHILRNSAGNTVGVYCMGRDVTEIRDAFTRLKLLTNTIPGGIATFRCKPGSIETIYASDGIGFLSGYSKEDYQSNAISPLQLVFEQDRWIIRKQIELLMAGTQTLEFVFRINTKDGGYKWISAKGHATDRVGDAFTVSTVLTDVTEAQEEKEQLRRTEEEYRIAATHSNRTICRYVIQQQTLYVSNDVSTRLNLPSVIQGIPYGKENLAKISEDTRQAYLNFYEGIIKGDKEHSVCFKKRLGNSWRWLDARATTVFDGFGKPVSAIVSYVDITEQLEKEAIYSHWQNSITERPEASFTLFRANLSKGVSFESRSGSLLDIEFGNTNCSFDELTAQYVKKRVYADDRERYRAFLRADTMLAEYTRGHRSDSIEYREIVKDGGTRWLKLSVDLVKYPNSEEVEVYLMYENIDERKQNELRTIERAETDALTGLLNRAAFAVRVNQLIGASAQGVQHALLILDIDGFKQVNDIFGHGAGDEALTDVADLLSKTIRSTDLVGRLGGDEFFVFLSDVAGKEAVAKKAKKICEITRKVFNVDVTISSSIGIAMYPTDGEGFESLYKTADETLYRVKDMGKDGYAFSDEQPVTELEIRQKAGVESSAVVVTPKKRRILIVDDSKVDRTILYGFFKNDYIIEQAQDGASAIRILRHYGTAISVVLLDLVMPEMDGYEVLKKVQENDNTRPIPIIVVSADESRETSLKVIQAGATDIITKPIDTELLRIRVEAAISRAENERLRAQNSFLLYRNTQTGSFRAALEYSGIIVITLDWITGEFLYSPGIESRLCGKYDGRALWRILLSDMVTDEQTVQTMQQLIHDLSMNREASADGCIVRLKTTSGLFRMFDFRGYKENNDYGLANKIIITLRELATNETAH